jgi:hypothetical protein
MLRERGHVMKKANVVVFGLLALGVGLGAAACGGSTDVPVLQNSGSDLNAIDAGTGKCGATACTSGQLCCASADESCTPTCTSVATCPVYGRPCKLPTEDGGTVDAAPPPPPPPPPAFTWYTTCGDPVCRAPADGGTPVVCPAVGSPCKTKGEMCGDPATADCGVVQVCDDHDPKGGAGGCPISTKKAKDEIAYVDAAALQRLHDETLQMRLATYRYKGPFVDPKDPNAKHLGFIVEDQPQSLSVDRGHDRVDLYGYMSMAVATMQVQEKEIAQLKREIADVKATCATKAR